MCLRDSVHTIATRAFAFCSAVESIEVASDNKYFHSSGNCLIYSAPYNTILAGCKNSVIPTDGSITYIDECAFARCSIENIVIPEGVQTIGKGAFAGCDELRSVVLPESLKEIYEEAFASCAFLSAATFNGTTEQWLNIEKGNGWKELTSDFIITCTDGRVTASGYVLGKDDQF